MNHSDQVRRGEELLAAIALSVTLIKASDKRGPRASAGPDPRTSPWSDVPFLWLTLLVTAVAFCNSICYSF